jgi:hypothetical protein
MLVPDAPVGDSVTVRKSESRPHWPQILHHTLDGQWLWLAMSSQWLGPVVLGTCGPHTALETTAGIEECASLGLFTTRAAKSTWIGSSVTRKKQTLFSA